MKSWIKVAVASVLLLGANGAFAQVVNTDDNTNAGTTISNTATVNYEVGTISQSLETGTAEFMVDRAILVTVASVAGTDVVPGATNQVLEYTVTNDSNATLDFVLSAEQPGSDDFDVAGVTFVQDADSNDANEGIYDGGDSVITTINDLAEEATVTIFVLANIPGTISNTDTSDVILIATAYETDGTTLVVETNTGVANQADGPDTPLTTTGVMFMDTVFGDGAGTATLTPIAASAGPVADVAGDGVGDGHHSATATYTVASADITVAKSSVVVSDPFNLTVNPKAIPGATIRYCIEITNGGTQTAENVTVTDAVPDDTDYVDGTLRMDTDCNLAGSVLMDDDADPTGTEDDTDAGINRGNVSAGPNRVVTTIEAELAPGEKTATRFDVIIR